MTHSRLEQLVLIIGSAAILGSLALAIPVGSEPETIEVVAQLMLAAVLFAAVRHGRRGGTVAASLAAVIYVALRLPGFVAVPPTPLGLWLIAARVAAYGLVGIGGGEATHRLLYSLLELKDRSAIDEWSHALSEQFFARELEQALARSARYGEPFSLVLISISAALTSDLRPSRQRAIVRSVSNALRADVRMVDEVARLTDGRFAVLLPHTPKSGGAVACDRLVALTRTTLAARDEAVTAQLLGAPEDEGALRALLGELSTAHAEAQSASGA